MNDFFDDMCYKLSPKHITNQNLQESIKFDTGTLIFTECDNRSFKPKIDNNDKVIRLVVYGGIVANIAESELSTLLIKHREILEELIYTPDRERGGLMIRFDCLKCEVFPSLKSITLNCDGIPVLLNNYILPALDMINIVINQRYIDQKDYDVIKLKLLDKFNSIRNIIFCTRTQDEINPIKI